MFLLKKTYKAFLQLYMLTPMQFIKGVRNIAKDLRLKAHICDSLTL